MGWEERGGRRYYYRKRREGETVVSEYVGAGAFAELIAEAEELERARREQERTEVRAEEQALRRLRETVERAGAAARALTGGVLVAAGFHTHRGQWRRSRSYDNHQDKGGDMSNQHVTVNGVPHRLEEFSDEAELNAFIKLYERVDKEKPKTEAVVRFREALRERPEVWRLLGNVVEQARGELLRAVSPGSMGMQEMARLKAEELSRELGYAEAPPLERVLIDQVTLTWVHLYTIQVLYSRKLGERHTLELARHYERRLSAAQRRHLRAVEALARVRKLAGRSPVQINIAGQQVNMAG